MLDKKDIEILKKFLDDVYGVNMSEDQHAMENLLGLYDEDTSFINVIEKIVGYDEEPMVRITSLLA